MNPIVERIKKLLRMKRGGTPAEVETALGLARKIAAEHGIDLESIDPEEKSGSSFAHKNAYSSKKVRYDHEYAAKLVETFFNVDVLYVAELVKWTFQNGAFVAPNRPRRLRTVIVFVGRVFEIEIALYIFTFLCRHFSRSWKHRGNRRLRSRQSFVYGMFSAIYQKLKSQQVDPQSMSLVTSRKSYLNKNFPGLTQVEASAPDLTAAAHWAGWQEGLKTNLRKGVETPQPLQLGL